MGCSSRFGGKMSKMSAWLLRIEKINVSIFGVILGTGGVALASQMFLPLLTVLLTYLLTILFVLFTALLVLKVTLYPRTVRAELQHPIPGNFYALQPISAVILAILYRRLFPSSVDIALLAYGGILIFGLAVYLPYHFFADMNIEFSQLHGGWFITPVATILVTDAILLYPINEVNLTIALAYFGIGTLLFLLVLSVLFFRLLSHTLPPVELAPANFIVLAPIGILIADLLQFSNAAGIIFETSLNPAAVLAGSALWGFGLWAALVNMLLLIKYSRTGFPFHMGWWSFVFPTAAFTLGTLSLSKFLEPFQLISEILYVCLVALWAFISIRTLAGWVVRSLRFITNRSRA